MEDIGPKLIQHWADCFFIWWGNRGIGHTSTGTDTPNVHPALIVLKITNPISNYSHKTTDSFMPRKRDISRRDVPSGPVPRYFRAVFFLWDEHVGALPYYMYV